MLKDKIKIFLKKDLKKTKVKSQSKNLNLANIDG